MCAPHTPPCTANHHPRARHQGQCRGWTFNSTEESKRRAKAREWKGIAPMLQCSNAVQQPHHRHWSIPALAVCTRCSRCPAPAVEVCKQHRARWANARPSCPDPGHSSLFSHMGPSQGAGGEGGLGSQWTHQSNTPWAVQLVLLTDSMKGVGLGLHKSFAQYRSRSFSSVAIHEASGAKRGAYRKRPRRGACPATSSE